MIQIISQSTAHTHDGKTRLTLTIEIPAREQIGGPLELERGVAAGAQWHRPGGDDRGSRPL